MHNDQVEFILGMQGFFSICKLIDVIYHIKKLKIKMTISVDKEKPVEKIQYPYYDKNPPENWHRRKLPQDNKGNM